MADSAEQLVEQLRDFRTRAAAKQRLLAMGAEAVEPLIKALRDSSEGVRWAAATMLGQLRDERAIDPLIEALKDSPTTAAAADALRAITGQDFGHDSARWTAWRTGKPAETPTAPRSKPEPLTDAELVRQGLADIAEEVQQSGELFLARIARPDGRHQIVHVNPSHKDSEGTAVVVIDTVCGLAMKGHFEWALRKNLDLPFGAIAVKDIGNEPHFVILNTLLRETADPAEIRSSVLHIARWGDAIEKALSDRDTH